MDKRTFLKYSMIAGAGAMIGSNLLAENQLFENTANPASETGSFELPELPYAYDALEPYIDAQTMELHHSKHHAGYTRKFNKGIEAEGLQGKSLEDIFKQVSNYPDGIRNNGGGYYNHKLFWEVLSPGGGGNPGGDLAKAIDQSFGSFKKFKEEFSMAASKVFGSGWGWLIAKGDELVITTTANQDNPLMDIAVEKGTPLLNIDVWEHAYYLKYQNQRKEYIKNFWNIVNWNKVEANYLNK